MKKQRSLNDYVYISVIITIIIMIVFYIIYLLMENQIYFIAQSMINLEYIVQVVDVLEH